MAVRLITLVRVKPAEFSVDSAQHTICSLNSERPRLSAGLMYTARMPTCSLKPFGPSSGESSAHRGSFPITHKHDFLDYYARRLSPRHEAGSKGLPFLLASGELLTFGSANTWCEDFPCPEQGRRGTPQATCHAWHTRDGSGARVTAPPGPDCCA